MSSWLAQATEIMLTQSPYISDNCTEVSQNFNYTITYSPETPPLSSLLSRFFNKQTSSVKDNSSQTISKSVTVATPKEKILYFGSSLSSQLPKNQESTTSSSPWHLFTTTHSKQEKLALFKSLLESKETYQPSEQKMPFSHKDSNPCSSQLHAPIKQSNSSTSCQLPKQFKPDESRYDLQKEAIQREEKAQDNHKNYKHSIFPEQKRLKDHHTKSNFQSFFQKDSRQNQKDKEAQTKTNKVQRKRKKHASSIVPIISPPTIGIFSLCYLLTKQGILSDFISYSAFRDSLESTEKEMNALHNQRIKKIEKAIEKERKAETWGALARLVYWVGSWIGFCCVTIGLASGIGVVPYCLLFTALISIVLEILQMFSDSGKIDKLLPGDKETRAKILRCIKLALFILVVILSAVSIVLSKPALNTAFQSAISNINTQMTLGVNIIKCAEYLERSKNLDLKGILERINAKIGNIAMERDALTLRMEDLLDQLSSDFEQLSEVLHLQRDIERTFVEGIR
ncbi:hypothetical protein CP10139811_0456 [Chlamydia ibidis]|uniref:Uncharacterized protein n=2 Tax=Chlamydia ibidis TaxID=1405396 RepID=S7KK99_9CHLA|nr:hypothetical protein [Chlamydia ibidis]EPP34855.1 hypothetical protein CP10139811_0456 [Chlamydia ibidis]EQM62493.1 hypothetical protein H359_0834 [Chlamydia ibidis 10-1398/6]